MPRQHICNCNNNNNNNNIHLNVWSSTTAVARAETAAELRLHNQHNRNNFQSRCGCAKRWNQLDLNWIVSTGVKEAGLVIVSICCILLFTCILCCCLYLCVCSCWKACYPFDVLPSQLVVGRKLLCCRYWFLLLLLYFNFFDYIIWLPDWRWVLWKDVKNQLISPTNRLMYKTHLSSYSAFIWKRYAWEYFLRDLQSYRIFIHFWLSDGTWNLPVD